MLVPRIPPKRICLSGGGIRVVSFLGALEVLEEEGLLRYVKEYIGTSAGAFLGFALCIGYTIQELKKICIVFDFSEIRQVEPEEAFLFFDTFGLDNGERLMSLLRSLLKQRGLSQDMTFADMTGCRLRCYATDLVSCRQREFSVRATPTVRLIDALRATMGLTFYFTPTPDPITGHLLTDGGIVHNYPMAFLTEEERRDTLGLTFSTSHASEKPVEDMYQFLENIFACIYIPRSERVEQETAGNTIVIPNGHYPSWNFEASVGDRTDLMDTAAKATRDYLASPAPPALRIKRRYSVS